MKVIGTRSCTLALHSALPRMLVDAAFSKLFGGLLCSATGLGGVIGPGGGTAFPPASRGSGPKAVSLPKPVCAATLAHRQLLFPIEPPELLQVQDDRLPIQHDMDAAITKTTMLGRHFLHSLAGICVIAPDTAIPHARPINRQNVTRPTLAHTMLSADMSHRVPLHIGRHHFFDATSFKMALSSMVSASNFFSLAASVTTAYIGRPSHQPFDRTKANFAFIAAMINIARSLGTVKKVRVRPLR